MVRRALSEVASARGDRLRHRSAQSALNCAFDAAFQHATNVEAIRSGKSHGCWSHRTGVKHTDGADVPAKPSKSASEHKRKVGLMHPGRRLVIGQLLSSAVDSLARGKVRQRI